MPELHTISAEQLTDSDVETISQLSDEFGIEISALGYYPNPLCPDLEEAGKYVEHIQKVISASRKNWGSIAMIYFHRARLEKVGG